MSKAPVAVTYRFPPWEVYAAPGKKNRVLGKVAMNVAVSPDGLVKHVEILRGAPLLAEAAHDEARRWFYLSPFRKCGQPV